MSLRSDYVDGEELPADDVNDIVNALVFNGGDGHDGALNVTSGTTTIDCTGLGNVIIKHYTTFNISAGATLAFSNVPAGGIIFVPFVQGAVTWAGTIDLDSCGADGGAGRTLNCVYQTISHVDGYDGTDPFNNFGAAMHGKGGLGGDCGYNHISTMLAFSAASGASGAANSIANGVASALKNFGGEGGANGVAAGVTVAAAIIAFATRYGISICCGAGGASGGISGWLETGSALSGTSAAGTKGGGAIMMIAGGNVSLTGTLKMRSVTPSSGTENHASASDYSISVAGSSAGAAGVGVAFVRKSATLTNTLTVLATAGSPAVGIGAGITTPFYAAGNAAASADGTFAVVRTL